MKYALNTLARVGQKFIRNGFNPLCDLVDRYAGPENSYFITFVSVNSRDIDHGHIHTYISNDWRQLTIDQHLSLSITESPAVTVGIANGDCSKRHFFSRDPSSAITNGVVGSHLSYLRDHSLQGWHWLQGGFSIFRRVDAIKADPQSHHVELVLRQPENAGRV